MQAVPAEPVAVDPAVPAAADGVWAPHRRRLTIGLVLTITLVAFESLAISTVMPVVSDDLGGLGLYGWVFSGFFLGSLLGIVTAGQSADARGTAFPFAVGLGLFSVGLLVGGLAPSMPILIAARVAQGVGAGAIPAVAYTSVGRGYPAHLRPRVFAVFSSAWVIPGLVGPAASGAIEHALGWRAVFLALLPLVAIAGAIALPQLSRTPPVVDDDAELPDRANAQADLSTRSRSPSEPVEPVGRERSVSADRRVLALVLIAGVAAVLVASNGLPILLAAALVVVGAPAALWAFLRLVPAGTIRFAPGMPAAVMVRGVLTFAFFGTDAFVSLTFQEVRDRPTWVAGAALTAATVAWTVAAWVQERWIQRVGPRHIVTIGFGFLTAGVLGMQGALGPLPVPLSIAVWALAGFGIGLAYSPISVTVLGLAEPGREGEASASLQLTDVLGIALGTGVGGAFVALGEAQGWEVRSGLSITFAITLIVAALGILAARRLPTALPG
jgi:MFS family permease